MALSQRRRRRRRKSRPFRQGKQIHFIVHPPKNHPSRPSHHAASLHFRRRKFGVGRGRDKRMRRRREGEEDRRPSFTSCSSVSFSGTGGAIEIIFSSFFARSSCFFAFGSFFFFSFFSSFRDVLFFFFFFFFFFSVFSFSFFLLK